MMTPPDEKKTPAPPEKGETVQTDLHGGIRHTTTGPLHCLSILDVAEALPGLLAHASALKHTLGKNGTLDIAKGKTLGLLFEKASTRTRISFEVGFKKLGGDVIVLNSQETQLGRGETLEDTALVMGRYLDALMVRAHSAKTIQGLAAHSPIPVVNGLDDLEHPCQTLADLLTIQEHFGHLDSKTIAFVGDCANNVATSLLFAAPVVGMDIKLLCPPGYAPSAAVYAKAHALATEYGTTVTVDRLSPETMAGSDVVVTDTWVSMGDEKAAAKRRAAFAGYTVTEEVMGWAKDDAVFLHCLPAHYGDECTHAVAHGPQSLVFDAAENRMWAQMALLVHLMGLEPGL